MYILVIIISINMSCIIHNPFKYRGVNRMNSDNYITTKEVAQRLNKSISTIYRYVNEKKLRPVYEDKWQIDSSLLFREEDVDRLIEEQQNKPGYTTGEVAAKLSKHPSTIAMYIKTGKLKTERKKYKGRILNFISLEELDRIKEEFGEAEKGYLNIFDKQNNIYLYQSYRDYNGNTARIMSLEEPLVAELENGSNINIDMLKHNGYVPVFDLKPHKYISKKGYLRFQFKEKPYLNSSQLNLIETLIIGMGYKNVKIREDKEDLTVFVKPGLLKVTRSSLISCNDELNAHLAFGSIVQRHDGLLLQSDYMPVLTHVRKDIKEKLKHFSRLEKVTLDDYLESIIDKHFELLKNDREYEGS
jgi:excisionase family DNA binding protein